VKAFILIDSTISMPPDRIANMHAVGNREGRSYATKDEFVANYKVRPAGSTAAPEVIRHLAQNSGRQFDDGRWRYKFDRNVYAKRERMVSFPYWNNIKIPALLIRGDRSARITPEIIAEVQSRAPQVKVADVANSDHHVTLDNPHGFVEVATEFLNKNK
jgi:pimeloyl-ACP methyl ester carboxylesterase